MTRTPDEIKKGLECCRRVEDCCKEWGCPYSDGGFDCLRRITSDALALIKQFEADKIGLLESSHEIRKDMIARIQQLEAELSDAKNNHQHTIGIAERQKRQIEKLKKVVVRLNTELEEAVETIKRMACCRADCGGCVHLKEEPDKNCIDLDFDCEQCKEQCACYRCNNGSNYEWNGAQKN